MKRHPRRSERDRRLMAGIREVLVKYGQIRKERRAGKGASNPLVECPFAGSWAAAGPGKHWHLPR